MRCVAAAAAGALAAADAGAQAAAAATAGAIVGVVAVGAASPVPLATPCSAVFRWRGRPLDLAGVHREKIAARGESC